MIGNLNSAELRPVELARAYLLKKMMTKVLREDADADALRASPCSAHDDACKTNWRSIGVARTARSAFFRPFSRICCSTRCGATSPSRARGPRAATIFEWWRRYARQPTVGVTPPARSCPLHDRDPLRVQQFPGGSSAPARQVGAPPRGASPSPTNTPAPPASDPDI